MKFRIFFLTPLIALLVSSCGQQVQETTPVRKDVVETVFASGTLEAEGTYNLVAQSNGYLSRINFEENDIVDKGEVLAQIDNQQNEINRESAEALYRIAQQNVSEDSPQLIQAKLEADKAREKMEFERNQKERYEKLWNANSVSKTAYESAKLEFENARASYEQALASYESKKQDARQQLVINKAQKKANAVSQDFNALKAVYPGKVYKKFKQLGDYVSQGDVLATIGSTDTIYARVSVDEGSIKQIKIGQPAKIQLNTDPDKVYEAYVKEILPAFNEDTQSFTCKIYFKETVDFKVINTQLQANIITGKSDNALLIPRNYLQYGNTVMVKGKDEPVKVETNFVSSEWVQVVSGIEETDVIITDKIK